jgi:hypothetical protein
MSEGPFDAPEKTIVLATGHSKEACPIVTLLAMLCSSSSGFSATGSTTLFAGPGPPMMTAVLRQKKMTMNQTESQNQSLPLRSLPQKKQKQN